MPNLLKIGNLLFQFGDFIVKSVVHYADTDEGQKEWGDVVAAFIELDLLNPSDVLQGVSVERAGEEKPLSKEDIERTLESFNRPVEQAEQGSDATGQRLIRRMKLAQTPGDDIPF